METLRIRNWDKWQSYRKDRGQPPWIKLHREVMRNVDWVSLTDAQRGQLVAIWLLAADHDGVIPASPSVIKKLCFMDSEPDLQTFMDHGFIEHGATLTPERRQDDNVLQQSDAPEKSRGRVEAEKNTRLNGARVSSEEIERVFSHWQTVFKHPKAQLTTSRRKVIATALKDYPESVLLESISGYRKSPYHMGDNEHKAVYDGIELILRDAKHIDQGVTYLEKAPLQNGARNWKPEQVV